MNQLVISGQGLFFKDRGLEKGQKNIVFQISRAFFPIRDIQILELLSRQVKQTLQAV